MSVEDELRHLLPDSKTTAVLSRLYRAALSTDPQVRAQCHAHGIQDEEDARWYTAMREAYMPVTPAFGKLLYTLVRSSRARTVVEFGTSFGVSTLFMAAALRSQGVGRLVTVELDTQKSQQARQNLRSAGLEDYVEFHCGHACEVLRHLSLHPIDVLFLDGPKRLYVEVLKLLEPQLADNAIVVSDNSELQSANPYIAHLRAPNSGYTSVSLSTEALGQQYRHELAIR